MVHRLLAAKTGWGKSWYGQAIMEANLPEYPVAAVVDYKDEYRGLVEAGLARHLIVGPKEAGYSVKSWQQVFESNPRLVLARYRLDAEEWRDVVANITAAVRRLGQEHGGAFIAYEEAHFLAPQRGNVPAPIKGVATTGRGEQVSSLWMTQRLSELTETVIAQQDERLFGAFTSSADLDKIGKFTEYNEEIHNPNKSSIGRGVPDALTVEGESLPVRKFTEDGHTVGSEWIFSDDAGATERRDTRTISPSAEHYGPEGREIHDPG